MYGCESWTVKKAESQRIDAFELGCWRKLLRVPWTARKSNQSILREISPEYSLEGMRLKLKFQYFGHLMQRTDSLGKTLMLGKIEGGRRRGQQRMRWMASLMQWTWVWVQFSSVQSLSHVRLCYPKLLLLRPTDAPAWAKLLARYEETVQPVPALASTIDNASSNKKEGWSNQKLIYMGKGYVRGSNHQRNWSVPKASNYNGNDYKENYHKCMSSYSYIIDLVISK